MITVEPKYSSIPPPPIGKLTVIPTNNPPPAPKSERRKKKAIDTPPPSPLPNQTIQQKPQENNIIVKPIKMKKWPDDPSELLPYDDIIKPLKEILNRGYRLFRKEEVKAFDYDGYNIGKQELQTNISPRVKLTEKFLEYEKKSGRFLIDTVLNIVFLLGIEQGRRTVRQESKPVEALLETLETYRETNKDQRIRIDELEVMLELREKFPTIQKEEFNHKVQLGVSTRRNKRVDALKSELQLDKSRSSFKFRTPKRAKFRALEQIARTLTKETTKDQWKQILEEHGWTLKDWLNKCKKKVINTCFL